MASSSPTPTVVTISGVPTQFLPQPTAWPTGTGCEGNIYEQLDGHFLAWDPYFGASISPSARTCLPPEVTKWWGQPRFAETSIALGPTFVCPEAYSAMTTITAKETKQIFCCPSNYDLVTVQTNLPSLPSQCVSVPKAGESITWMQIFSSANGLGITKTSSVVSAATITVQAIPVNGYDWATTTSPSAKSATTGADQAAASTASAAPAPSGGSSVAVAVGASVGVVLGLLVLGAVAFFLWRRRKRSAAQTSGASRGMPPSQSSEQQFRPSYKYSGTANIPPTSYSETAYAALNQPASSGGYPPSATGYHPTNQSPSSGGYQSTTLSPQGQPVYEFPTPAQNHVYEMPPESYRTEIDGTHKMA